MTIYGRRITDEDMKLLATYMCDEIRERLHAELAPCTHEKFLAAYMREDEEFLELMENEFDFMA